MAGVAVPKNRDYIPLKTIGRRWKDITAFREDLFSRVGDQMFHVQTKYELLYLLLLKIYPVNRKLEKKDESVERACDKVIVHFGFKLVQIKDIGTENNLKSSKAVKSSSDTFLHSILQIERLPCQEYNLLTEKVNADLHKLNELIQWYEGESCIKKFMTIGEVPKSSDGRTKFDFYQRCVKERGEIVKYQLYGLRKRALAKVQPYSKLLSMFVFDDRYDRPYDFARTGAESYFDCRRINLAKHRLDEFYLHEVDSMVQLYDSNKARFYRVYFRRIPWKRLFEDCFSHLEYLPASKDRAPIFNELLSLFKAERWMAFYALGLPQVEGLFSEMCLTVNPNSDFSREGLSKKVVSIRPHYQAYDNNLDYYQYYIPIQRNRFSHTGYDEDFQLKSYDLLVDLTHLLTVFSELDNPLVKVKRLHSKKNIKDFSSIEQFREYFDLLGKLSLPQLEIQSASVKNFEMSFLVASTNMIAIAEAIVEKLPIAFETFVNSVNEQFHKSGVEFDLLKSNQAQIHRLSKIEAQRYLILRIFRYPNEELEMLMNYFHFMTGFVKSMTSGSTKLRVAMNNLRDKFSKRLGFIAWTVDFSQRLNDD